MVLATARSQRLAHMLAGAVLHALKARAREVAPGVAPVVEGATVRGSRGCWVACGCCGGDEACCRTAHISSCCIPFSPAPFPSWPTPCQNLCPHHPRPSPAPPSPLHKQEDSEWLVVDAGSVVAHIFSGAAHREEYALEELWGGPGGRHIRRVAAKQTVHTLDSLK